MKHTTIGAVAALTLALAVQTAQAAPLVELDKLPVSSSLLQGLERRGLTPAQIDDFLVTLAQIDVYPDHANPRDAEGLDDPKVAKIYHAAPFLTPSPGRRAVGAEQFATHALQILDRADDLTASFDFHHTEAVRLSRQLARASALVQTTRDRLASDRLEPVERASLEALASGLAREVSSLEEDLEALYADGADGMARLPSALQSSIVNQFVLQMSRLGVSPTTDERHMLAASDTSQLVLAMAQIRARASTGQYGLRQVILESGYTERQRDVLSTYFALRPDVIGRGLPIGRLSVRSAAQSYIDQDGTTHDLAGTLQIRGVNLGTQGRCGGARSCNVLVEYTDLGARAASLLQVGGAPTLLPVMFEGDVSVRVPDFVGEVRCNLHTGWMANGRADVRDGAIVYNGDLSDQIHFNSFADGGCDFSIQEGSKDSAFYSVLNDLNQHYLALRFEREQRAKEDKDAYERRVRDELAQRQRNSSARRSGGFFGSLVRVLSGGSITSQLFGFVVGQARGFYWHTTRLNTSSTDDINFRQSYQVRNLTETRSFGFDGFPLVCYSDDGHTLVACPDAAFPDADTEAGAAEDVCPDPQFICN